MTWLPGGKDNTGDWAGIPMSSGFLFNGGLVYIHIQVPNAFDLLTVKYRA